MNNLYDLKQDITAKVIKDSKYLNTRIITIEATYPKFLQAELNTHRMLVKNAASSRAIPIDSFSKNLFIPEKVGINKSGMAATEFLIGDDLKQFQDDWLEIYSIVLEKVNYLKAKYNPHKQLLNRLLEPFNMTKGVFTGTFDTWMHILGLRNHPDAQPEIQELAKKIENVINLSNPQILSLGNWHLPYVDSVEAGENDKNIKISASCIAQVSYRKVNDSEEKALNIFEKLHLLNNDKNIKKHISPVQHICQAVGDSEVSDEVFDFLYNNSQNKKYYAEMTNNFIQASKYIENDNLLHLKEKIK